MKKIVVLALGAVVLLTGCRWVIGIRGNGHIATDQRNVGSFSEIEARGGVDIEWRNGPPSLRITTDENLIPYIETSVENDRLLLRNREQISPTRKLIVVVSSDVRKGARLSGAVNLTVPQITGPKFYFRSTGASVVKLDGVVDELLADMTGASDLRAKNLQVKSAEISATGAANAELSVSDSLKVSITGAGSVTYHGNPPQIQKSVTGAGSIRHKD